MTKIDQDTEDTFRHLLFSMGMLSGMIMREGMPERFVQSMQDPDGGPRLTGHMQTLHDQLGRLLLAASMKGEVKDEPA